MIPVVAILSGAAVKIAKIRSGADRDLGTMEDSPRFEALEQEVGQLRQELTETQERLDFAERLLAKGRDADRLGSA
jgi:predicted  nucleic acid-binding Zn-ribbon protein